MQVKRKNSQGLADMHSLIGDEEACAHNLPVIGHIPRSMTMSRAVELGMKGLEHMRINGKIFDPTKMKVRR